MRSYAAAFAVYFLCSYMAIHFYAKGFHTSAWIIAVVGLIVAALRLMYLRAFYAYPYPRNNSTRVSTSKTHAERISR